MEGQQQRCQLQVHMEFLPPTLVKVTKKELQNILNPIPYIKRSKHLNQSYQNYVL